MLHAALDWMCGLGKVECSAMRQGQPCDEPDNVIAHSTYTFDSYYHKKERLLIPATSMEWLLSPPWIQVMRLIFSAIHMQNPLQIPL
ncbi:hypothetical protein HN51_048154 [Arachis hypogaea]